MSPLNTEIALYSLLPTSCMLLGGLTGSYKTLSKSITSLFQHFAAGVVFAAVAIELLPEVTKGHSAWAIGIGFTAGTLIMLTLKIVSDYLQTHDTTTKNLPLGLVTAVGIDLLVDGILIGVAFLVGRSGGILLAVALGIEILFLGLSTGATLKQKKMRSFLSVFLIILLSSFVLLGALIGSAVISHLPTAILSEVIAFGIAALLYLVTEELLVEAHETEENAWITAAFFVGFLLIIILEVLA